MANIQEDLTLINQFRATNASIPVFASSELNGTAVHQLILNTRVQLTGVKGVGIAQIKEPIVGWVDASRLKLEELPPEQNKGAKFRVRPEFAPNGLIAFDIPGASQNDGPAAGADVFLVEPPDHFIDGQGRKFVLVFYIGINGRERIGYVSQGPANSTPGDPNSNFEGPLP